VVSTKNSSNVSNNNYYAPSAPVVTTGMPPSSAPVVTTASSQRYQSSLPPSSSTRYPTTGSTPTTLNTRSMATIAPPPPTYFTSSQSYHMHHPQPSSTSQLQQQQQQPPLPPGARRLPDHPPAQPGHSSSHTYYQPGTGPSNGIASRSTLHGQYPHPYARGASTSSLVPASSSQTNMNGHRNSLGSGSTTTYASQSPSNTNTNTYGANQYASYSIPTQQQQYGSSYRPQSQHTHQSDIGGGRGALLRAMAAPPVTSSPSLRQVSVPLTSSTSNGMVGMRTVPLSYNGVMTNNNGVYPNQSLSYQSASSDYLARAAVGASGGPLRLRQRL
jgi:hypothetical protein